MSTTNADPKTGARALRTAVVGPRTFDATAGAASIQFRAGSPHRWGRRREIDAIEDERQRLAQELHDEAGYRLTAAVLHLDAVAARPDADPELREHLRAARQLIQECTAGFQDIAFNLRPRILTDLGLAPAIRCLARRARAASGVEMSVDVRGTEQRLGDQVELAAFRVVQEALTNVAKYARASHVSVRVAFFDDGAEISVTDDGVGFGPMPTDADRPRLGLKGMRERVELVGGTIGVRSEPGRGTTIHAWLPKVGAA